MLLLNIDSLPDGKILQYKGIVDYEVVIGVNIFHDIFASWRDVFGGETKSYQKELIKLKESTKLGLIQKARRMGANAVIGLKIDIEELSGQGKSMFMLSMQGTAVVLHESLINTQKEGVLHLEDALNKSIALESKNALLRMDENYFSNGVTTKFDLITEHDYWDVESLEKILELLKSLNISSDTLIKIFSNIDTSLTYEFIRKNIGNIKHGFLESIKQGLSRKSAYDAEFIIELISDKDFRIRYKSLIFAVPFLNHFSRESISELLKVKQFLDESFDKSIESESVKKMMKEDIITACIRCSKPRKIIDNNIKKCEYCGVDTLIGYETFKYNGINQNINLNDIKVRLQEIINVLEATFKRQG